jgi:hypothetical protein
LSTEASLKRCEAYSVSGDAKLVALRIGHRGPPDVPPVLVVHDDGAEPHESFDFGGPIVSLEVEVETVAVASSPSASARQSR